MALTVCALQTMAETILERHVDLTGFLYDPILFYRQCWDRRQLGINPHWTYYNSVETEAKDNAKSNAQD